MSQRKKICHISLMTRLIGINILRRAITNFLPLPCSISFNHKRAVPMTHKIEFYRTKRSAIRKSKLLEKVILAIFINGNLVLCFASTF